MALHTEDALRRPGILQILDLLFAIAAFEACGAKGLIPGKDGEILNLVPTYAATVRTIVADERSVA